MTIEEKQIVFNRMLDEDVDIEMFKDYLRLATEKLLVHLYPFGTAKTEVDREYEHAEIELAIALYNQRGVEGQISHTENGVARRYRTEQEILKSIPRMAGLPI